MFTKEELKYLEWVLEGVTIIQSVYRDAEGNVTSLDPQFNLALGAKISRELRSNLKITGGKNVE